MSIIKDTSTIRNPSKWLTYGRATFFIFLEEADTNGSGTSLLFFKGVIIAAVASDVEEQPSSTSTTFLEAALSLAFFVR